MPSDLDCLQHHEGRAKDRMRTPKGEHTCDYRVRDGQNWEKYQKSEKEKSEVEVKLAMVEEQMGGNLEILAGELEKEKLETRRLNRLIRSVMATDLGTTILEKYELERRLEKVQEETNDKVEASFQAGIKFALNQEFIKAEALERGEGTSCKGRAAEVGEGRRRRSARENTTESSVRWCWQRSKEGRHSFGRHRLDVSWTSSLHFTNTITLLMYAFVFWINLF